MSDYAHNESSPPRHNSDLNLHNESLEDVSNNSIIGKVKSRVSSMLPNRLSKWFSPSAKLQNESLNGSTCDSNTTIPTRRRRRIEIEEDNYEDDEDMQRTAEYQVNSRNTYAEQQCQKAENNDEHDDDEESQNSDDEYNVSSLAKQTRLDLNEERQPPSKKSRLNIDASDSPLITRHQPLLWSTPAVGNNSYLRNSASSTSASRSPFQRGSYLNLYANQSKKEPAFNFSPQKDLKLSTTKTNADIIDLISTPYEYADKHTEATNVYVGSRVGISSRKSLNIPTSTSPLTGVERVYASVSHLKRQPLSSAKTDLVIPLRRTSTTIQEEHEQKYCDATEKGEDILTDANANNYNGRLESSKNFSANKRQKLINGTDLNAPTLPESNEAIVIDSASESSESAIDAVRTNTSNAQQQRKSGTSNMSALGAANTRNSSRTSSFGNGLNFYSHLEGRKSLFSGHNHGIPNTLNNSTLSLTSLNRRQFNASIYGSTSALSDSRLLNTFSPFYKGKTTYGGAAAYNKYKTAACVNSVRITPTLIRPMSSLSTLSSNNSLVNNADSHVGDNSTISSTAKRILDLINDFATPLSEAKKMATSLKSNPNMQIPTHAKGRLNESDLNASRAIRLSQVRTPYSRPAVILQPSGNASGMGTAGGVLPPIKELQVPTMSQLLQMKKIQNTTEKARKIAQNTMKNTETSEYTLPDATTNITNNTLEQNQQKHTNKIRNKVTNSLRQSNISKDLQDEDPPPPVNLPNIAFPLMQSVPKIDIQLDKTSVSNYNNNIPEVTNICKSSESPSVTESSNDLKTISLKTNTFAFNPTPIKHLTQTDCKQTQLAVNKTTLKNDISSLPLKSGNNFTFSEPLKILSVPTATQNVIKSDKDKFKFSPPLDVKAPSVTTSTFGKIPKSQPKQSQLKEGSCLDALSKPFIMPPTITNKQENVKEQTTSGFGNQFKKSVNEWECNACMVRNKCESSKCVACETPRKENCSKNQQQMVSSTLSVASSAISNFGQKFKKSINEWECDACMLRNKQEVIKCVACETPRKGETPSSNKVPPTKSSFGDTFKPKADNWECQTCMISNKNEDLECIACQSKKPGTLTTISTAPTTATQFQFGFSASTVPATGITNANSNIDAGFKTLAAEQKASKWECDACMTRNDFHRTKCACCEQPRPGVTSAETNNATSTQFKFGATASSKFNFGFGNGSNAPKEDDLRKELASKTDETANLGFKTQPPQATQGFQFGIKPSSCTIDSKKDETDANNKLTGFKFGVSQVASDDKPKVSETPSTGLVFALKPLSTTTAAITTTISTSPLSSLASTNTNVKVSLSSTATSNSSTDSEVDNATGVKANTFAFGTKSTTSTTGFSFGKKLDVKQNASVSEEKKPIESFAFKTPTTSSVASSKSLDFVFSSPAISSNSTVVPTAITSTNNTSTSAAKTATTAAVKPMFSFGSSKSTISAAPAFGGFSFGSNTTNNIVVATTASSLFATVTSTSTLTTTKNATTTLPSTLTTTTTPAATNIFGSFGGERGLSNTSGTPIFGSFANSPANYNSTTVSSSTNNTSSVNTSQFGTFGSKSSTNVFGSFGGVSGVGGSKNSLAKSTEAKTTMPVFGNVAPSSTSQSSFTQPNTGGFVFGNVSTVPVATGSVTSTSATWPKTSFVFGSSASATTSSPNAPAQSELLENKEVPKPSLFGTFGSSTSNSNQQQKTSIFGAPAPSSVSSTASGQTNSGTNLFGTNSAPAATSIFGSNPSGNAATPAPAFGSSPFGGAASSTSATPTFGSTAASGVVTFGGFGGTTSNTTTNNTDVKKPEAAFNFGAASTVQSASGGFNFGSSAPATKPAFNFGGASTTQQPTFNFTGTAESQTSAKPFQFGATTSAPVFNFNRGTSEGTPNAPFQFNAGAAPVSSNIFAPSPTPGAQTSQQTKRKIRAPIRRVTQR